MQQDLIFGPFLATIFLTFAVWVYMFAVRIPFINNGNFAPNQLAIPGELARVSPPHVSNPSDNLKNLFEIPVLFYAVCLYLFVTGRVDTVHVACGWIFASFRALHSIVHCTFNHVLLRFWLYFVSTVAFWIMAFRAALA